MKNSCQIGYIMEEREGGGSESEEDEKHSGADLDAGSGEAWLVNLAKAASIASPSILLPFSSPLCFLSVLRLDTRIHKSPSAIASLGKAKQPVSKICIFGHFHFSKGRNDTFLVISSIYCCT